MKDFVKFLAVLLILAACEGGEDVRRIARTAYMPLKTGNFWVYSVHEKRYSPGAEPQVSAYEIKIVVADSFPSATGEMTYVLHRLQRGSEGDDWQPLDTWSARSDERQLVIAEENTSYVKLRYPVKPGSKWDGNALNARGQDEYEYADIGKSMEFDGLPFDGTIKVVQEKNEDAIVFRDLRKEIFAPDVGLVFKEVIQLNYCTDDACLGQQRVVDGFEITMVIQHYGK